ncbi:MAG: uroporphyrinogen decarboxylase family protein [Anaerolineales bacterium]
MDAWFYELFSDFALNEKLLTALMTKVMELKMAYWEKALAEVGDNVDVIGEADDFAGQLRLLISPSMYRRIAKPLHKKLFDFIHARTKAKIFFHSCGAIRPVIPDLVEIGVDILNPIQVSAAGMDTAELKREFGKDIVFWGGGVDTQRVLGDGTSQEVRADVRRRIEDLAPGGGFVFATVHNIQGNVPPENIMAMWEILQQYGHYHDNTL